MDLSSAVDWWEEWQLRILVIGSQCVQWLLFFSVRRRKSTVSPSSRFVIWLAYIGSDAVAIYALAALFNRHRKEQRNSDGKSVLEVVWAPVLLMHLGGQDCITAYNMEDNELWRRHILTAISQITVSIYVFCKSWRGGDKKLLQAAIMLFTVGGVRCLEKPYALRRSSITSLARSSDTTAWMDNKGRSCKFSLLEEYVGKIRALLKAQGGVEANHLSNQEIGEYDLEANHLPGAEDDSKEIYHVRYWERGNDQVNKLFVDLASPYHDRLDVTNAFLKLGEKEAYEWLQERLSDTFDFLYTKGMIDLPRISRLGMNSGNFIMGLAVYFRGACYILPFTAIGLFHKCHREAYNDKDVKVTYTLLSCTAALELLSIWMRLGPRLSGTVSQCSFMGFFALKEKYIRRMFIQRWLMPRTSSSEITILVFGHVKDWWKQHISDASDYMRFNNNRGQWAIQQAECGELLGWSIKGSFDESVLLWHIATDLCFYKMGASPSQACYTAEEEISGTTETPTWGAKSVHRVRAMGCREISNYMMYLLSAKPEMLMPGTRRNLFIAAYYKLKEILEDQEQPLLEQPMGLGRFLYRCFNLKEEKKQQLLEERSVAERILAKMEKSPAEEGIIHDAWILAEGLLRLDEEKMWKVIEGVWVEMLCYSASRCRGYLHAKNLGTGVELLTFVWLLWSQMGMETLAERMQMPDAGGNAGAAQLGGLVVTAGSSLVDTIGETGAGV